MIHRTLLLMFVLGAGLSAGTARQSTELLQPQPVVFSSKQLPLDEILVQLQKQTGNAVKDARADRANPKIALPDKPLTFWQTMDLIGEKSGIGFSAYQEGGGVALVDRPYRKLQTDSTGAFRFAFKRIAATRDEGADTRFCAVTLDVVWEPSFYPLFINLQQATALVGKREIMVEPQGSRRVVEMGGTELELRLPAPERKADKIDSLKGSLHVIGVPKMLEFQFARPMKSMKAEQDGVQVRVEIETQLKFWRVHLDTEHPKRAIVQVDSFQESAWLQLTRVWLSWRDAKKQVVEVEGRELGYSKKIRGFVYEFPVPPQGAEVTLHYRVPSRVREFTVPFALRDLPLP